IETVCREDTASEKGERPTSPVVTMCGPNGLGCSVGDCRARSTGILHEAHEIRRCDKKRRRREDEQSAPATDEPGAMKDHDVARDRKYQWHAHEMGHRHRRAPERHEPEFPEPRRHGESDV